MSTVVSCTKETIETLSKKLQIVEDLNQRISEISAVVGYYDTHIKELSDTAFVQLVGDLTISGEETVIKVFVVLYYLYSLCDKGFCCAVLPIQSV